MLLSQIRQYWTGRAEGYSQVNRHELATGQDRVWFHEIQKYLPEGKELKILDVGTGPGFFAILLAGQGYEVTAVDYTEAMLIQARQNAGALAEKIHFRQMDAQDLDFPDETFDVVISRNLTWNLEDPGKAYAEWMRVLKEGGKLLNFDANWYHHLFDEEKRRQYEADREQVEALQMEDIIAARLQEKKIRFEINMGDPLPHVVRGDKVKVHQILINILGNAVKFTEKGKITLDIDFVPRQDGKLQISFMVTDTGIGIKKEDMGKLFNRFSQIDGRYNRKVEGTGLGLVLSRKLARLMGGDVTASSEFGVGSCFRIVIMQKEGAYFKDAINGEKLKDFQAYVYEEDSEERWYLSRILSQLGVSTIFFHDERQLANLARQEGGEENRILFYEGNHKLAGDLGIGCRKVALMEYYARGADQEELDYYLRKPLDVYKVARVLMEEPFGMEETACPRIVLKDVRIAIVDDNRVNVKVAVTLLKEFGAKMEAFTSGEGILKALERGRTYDMIFMDHMMPEMSGVEVARRIREMPGEYAAKVVIIALTANAMEGVEEDYREAGMNDWIFKPVNMERMQEKIIKYLPPEKVMYCEENEG